MITARRINSQHSQILTAASNAIFEYRNFIGERSELTETAEFLKLLRREKDKYIGKEPSTEGKIVDIQILLCVRDLLIDHSYPDRVKERLKHYLKKFECFGSELDYKNCDVNKEFDKLFKKNTTTPANNTIQGIPKNEELLANAIKKNDELRIEAINIALKEAAIQHVAEETIIKRNAEAQAQKKLEEEAQIQRELAAKKHLEEETRKKLEEENQRQRELQAKKQLEEEARRKRETQLTRTKSETAKTFGKFFTSKPTPQSLSEPGPVVELKELGKVQSPAPNQFISTRKNLVNGDVQRFRAVSSRSSSSPSSEEGVEMRTISSPSPTNSNSSSD